MEFPPPEIEHGSGHNGEATATSPLLHDALECPAVVSPVPSSGYIGALPKSLLEAGFGAGSAGCEVFSLEFLVTEVGKAVQAYGESHCSFVVLLDMQFIGPQSVFAKVPFRQRIFFAMLSHVITYPMCRGEMLVAVCMCDQARRETFIFPAFDCRWRRAHARGARPRA